MLRREGGIVIKQTLVFDVDGQRRKQAENDIWRNNVWFENEICSRYIYELLAF